KDYSKDFHDGYRNFGTSQLIQRSLSDK
ncbi:inovirus Gp2 family protein, partial [Escherichia coli]|nr:inovirus Gp2 family protein [Escherichia coli]